tara:strand:- start:1522 stop:1824 length:303 start_codon:yes stop_codon:yes gene_type:complete
LSGEYIPYNIIVFELHIAPILTICIKQQFYFSVLKDLFSQKQLLAQNLRRLRVVQQCFDRLTTEHNTQVTCDSLVVITKMLATREKTKVKTEKNYFSVTH